MAATNNETEIEEQTELSGSKTAGCSLLNVTLTFEMPTTMKNTNNVEAVISAMLTEFGADYLKSADSYIN